MLITKNNFYKIAPCYEDNAIVQKKMAKELISSLKSNVGSEFSNIFEIGCGTGLLTRFIQKELIYHHLYLNDLHNFVSIVGSYNFIEGDIEEIDIHDKFDLIISNATFQWVKNLNLLLIKLANLLKKDGILAFTTFGEKNLKEIRAITGVGLNYTSMNDWIEILKENFEIKYQNEQEVFLYFDTPKDVLKHIKFTGVNSIKKTYWTKGDYFKFCNEYKEFKTENGYLLTYHPFYFIVCKK